MPSPCTRVPTTSFLSIVLRSVGSPDLNQSLRCPNQFHAPAHVVVERVGVNGRHHRRGLPKGPLGQPKVSGLPISLNGIRMTVASTPHRVGNAAASRAAFQIRCTALRDMEANLPKGTMGWYQSSARSSRASTGLELLTAMIRRAGPQAARRLARHGCGRRAAKRPRPPIYRPLSACHR